MRGWERVRIGLRCAYGCEIRYPEWAWFGKWPMLICEPCAAKYGITREAQPELPASDGMTSLADLAARWRA